MNITVCKEKLCDYQDVHGGGYAVNDLHIGIDEGLEPRVQRNIVINEVVEAYCRPWPKDGIDELVDFLVDALDQLEGLNE